MLLSEFLKDNGVYEEYLNNSIVTIADDDNYIDGFFVWNTNSNTDWEKLSALVNQLDVSNDIKKGK